MSYIKTILWVERMFASGCSTECVFKNMEALQTDGAGWVVSFLRSSLILSLLYFEWTWMSGGQSRAERVLEHAVGKNGQAGWWLAARGTASSRIYQVVYGH
jgi:hypothetical protein